MENFLPCLYAFLACMGFCFVFEIKKPLFIFLASLTGAFSWAAFLLLGYLGVETGQYFLATVVVSVLSEILARVLKAPAAIFLVIGIIPLVPGGGLYYTMDALLNGDMELFMEQGIHTAAYAASIAVGASMVTSMFRIFFWKKRPIHTDGKT